MFSNANLFNGDISQWNVSNVNDMSGMFLSALSFNGDISKWDVSSVTNMDYMFMSATSFEQQLCGDSWGYSKATKNDMFEGSSGSIVRTRCTSAPVFLPQSLAELKSAVDACLKSSPNGDCSDMVNLNIAQRFIQFQLDRRVTGP